jgi:hypothetical protein
METEVRNSKMFDRELPVAFTDTPAGRALGGYRLSRDHRAITVRDECQLSG